MIKPYEDESIYKFSCDEFINGFFSLLDGSQYSTDNAMDLVFDYFDRKQSDGEFQILDDIISKIDLDKMNTSLMRGFLVITSAAKNKFPNRPRFYDNILEKALKVYDGDEVRVKRVFGNLK